MLLKRTKIHNTFTLLHVQYNICIVHIHIPVLDLLMLSTNSEILISFVCAEVLIQQSQTFCSNLTGFFVVISAVGYLLRRGMSSSLVGGVLRWYSALCLHCKMIRAIWRLFSVAVRVKQLRMFLFSSDYYSCFRPSLLGVSSSRYGCEKFISLIYFSGEFKTSNWPSTFPASYDHS